MPIPEKHLNFGLSNLFAKAKFLDNACEAQSDEQHHYATDSVNVTPLMGLYWAIIIGALAVATKQTKNAQDQQRNRQQHERPLR
jgi:hypothetical protein